MTPSDRVSRLREALDAPDLESDRYRITETLGRGGMGTVYLADDLLLGRPVALKVLHLEDLSDDGVARMRREAETLARLEHPGIVPVHDLGTLPDGRVFYAMKRVKGERLDRWARADRPLAERLGVFLRIGEAVAFAHAHGVLHRDLKPENVMVGEFGEVLVLDWGVAKWVEDSRVAEAAPGPPAPNPEATAARGARDTRPGTVLGTPAYMPPEQAAGGVGRVDVRSDIYSLGATLAFLATGRPPDEPGEPPAPRALAAICARATAADPAGRYPQVADLLADVRRLLEGSRVQAHDESLWERTGRFLARHRIAVGLVAAYVLVRTILWFTIRR